MPSRSSENSSVQSVFILWAVSFRVRTNKHVPSIGTLFLKEARSLSKFVMNKRITLQKILPFQLASVQVVVIDVF